MGNTQAGRGWTNGFTGAGIVAAVLPSGTAEVSLTPLNGGDVTIDGGFWHRRREINQQVSLWAAYEQLEKAGNIAYLRAAATGSTEQPDVPHLNDKHVYKIFDSDVFKWLEAVAYAGPGLPPEIGCAATQVISLIEAAQRPSGYLSTWTQIHAPQREFTGWREGGELYCGGHLIQAGIAWYRAAGDTRLLRVAASYADLLCSLPDIAGGQIIPLHPGLEMALIELYRVTSRTRYLDLAKSFLDRRGYGRIGFWNFSEEYFLDERPVRDSHRIRGHAVMALFLLCGVADLAAEIQDAELLAVAEEQWADMVATKMYLTGGVGSRHHGEAFGDAYELPPDRAYCETCAAIGAVMLSWRLLLATGKAKYGELIEHVLYNAVLPGISLDGRGFFYVNPLHVREADQVVSKHGQHRRQPWFECACCPPNALRTLASIEQYIATASAGGLQIHQFAEASIGWRGDGGAARLIRSQSEQPWGDGRFIITVSASDERPWTLKVRQPSWSKEAQVTIEPAREDLAQETAIVREDGYITLSRMWAEGDRVTFGFTNPVKQVEADPRIGSCRGHIAITRGPLVYCCESADLTPGTRLDDVILENLPVSAPAEPLPPLDGALTFVLRARERPAFPRASFPYRATPPGQMAGPGKSLKVRAIPYFCWGNRGPAAMKVWMPSRTRQEDGTGRNSPPDTR